MPLPGFMAVPLMLPVLTRNPAVDVVEPSSSAWVREAARRQPDGPGLSRRLLPTTPFESWHGPSTAHRTDDLLTEGLRVSAAWTVPPSPSPTTRCAAATSPRPAA